ncbi:hypothetical protein Ancab_015577 [Ancistrocladus abbreviatus]
MVCVIAEKQLLENGGCCLGTNQLKKRCRACVVCDFPPACGPNAPSINLRMKEVILANDNVESGGRKGSDLSDAKVKANSGNLVEWQSQDQTDFPVKVEGMNGIQEDEGGRLVKESDNLRLDALAKESMLETPKLSQNAQKVQTRLLLKESSHETHESLEDSTRVVLESSGVTKHTDGLGFEERVDKNVKESSLLEYYLIPFNLVQKGRKYPPSRRVSAVQDFPPGCGTSVSHGHSLQVASDKENHLCLDKADAEKLKHLLMTDVKNIVVYNEDAVKTKMRRLVSAGIRDHAQVKSESHEGASVDMAARPIWFCKSSEVKDWLRNDEIKATGQLVLRGEADSSENDEQQHNDLQLVKKSRDFALSLPSFAAANSTDKGARSKEEAKSKEKGNALGRIDELAAKILKDKGKCVNTGKIIGPIPGVEVGDEFQYCVKLMIIGLHSQSQGGIDYIKQVQKLLATSIVACGGYANDMNSSDILIYTGHGGNTTVGDKQPEDQKLERGNLALKNGIDERTPLRVIRGFKAIKSLESADTRGKVVAKYTYDGQYTVEKILAGHWAMQ